MDPDGAAKDVWALMAQRDRPLPPPMALDMMLDATDGAAERRGECVTALLKAAGTWLHCKITQRMKQFYGSGAAHSVALLLFRGDVRGAAESLAMLCGENVYWLADSWRKDILTRTERAGLRSQIIWTDKARRVVSLCEQLDALR